VAIKRKTKPIKGLVIAKETTSAPLTIHETKDREGGAAPHALKPAKAKKHKTKHTKTKHTKKKKGRKKGTTHHTMTDQDVVNIVLAALQGGPLLLAVQDIVLQVIWQVQNTQSAAQAQPGSYQRIGGF
jgi:hypothetical protein